MVKLEIGTKVQVDLWNTKKRTGMAKNFGDTLDLVNAKSEFDLNKGDYAIIFKSYDNHAVLIPADNFAKALTGSKLDKIDSKDLINPIHQLLKDLCEQNGGILSINELFDKLKNTSIKYSIKMKHLIKVSKTNNLPFDIVSANNIIYFALNLSECPEDKHKILEFSKDKEYVTFESIQLKLKWSDVRIKRILDIFMEKGRFRVDNSYRKGPRYYLLK